MASLPQVPVALSKHGRKCFPVFVRPFQSLHGTAGLWYRGYALRHFSPQGIQPDAKTPTVQEWNLSIEQQTQPQHIAPRGIRRIVRDP